MHLVVSNGEVPSEAISCCVITKSYFWTLTSGSTFQWMRMSRMMLMTEVEPMPWWREKEKLTADSECPTLSTTRQQRGSDAAATQGFSISDVKKDSGLWVPRYWGESSLLLEDQWEHITFAIKLCQRLSLHCCIKLRFESIQCLRDYCQCQLFRTDQRKFCTFAGVPPQKSYDCVCVFFFFLKFGINKKWCIFLL